jgi:hypothetical protein
MIFLIKQVHTFETCPRDEGGYKTLFDEKAKGVKLKAVYADFCQHITYYVVESDDLEAVYDFLDPGWLKSTCTVTPVLEMDVDK